MQLRVDRAAECMRVPLLPYSAGCRRLDSPLRFQPAIIPKVSRTMANHAYLRAWTRDFSVQTMIAEFARFLTTAPLSVSHSSFDELIVSLFLTGPQLSTLPVKIYHYIEYNSDPTIAAISVVVVVISATVILLTERFVGLSRFL